MYENCFHCGFASLLNKTTNIICDVLRGLPAGKITSLGADFLLFIMLRLIVLYTAPILLQEVRKSRQLLTTTKAKETLKETIG